MTKIIIDIDPEDGEEFCCDCRFMNAVDSECVLFTVDLYCDATGDFMRCENCVEREMIANE